jgi:hypothetical protein
MTVKELIEKLQQLDPDLYVFRTGYESGYCDVDFISEPLDMALDVNHEDEWWYGPHDVIGKLGVEEKNKSKYKIVKGIIL